MIFYLSAQMQATYTKDSDIDLHIANTKAVDYPADLVRNI